MTGKEVQTANNGQICGAGFLLIIGRAAVLLLLLLLLDCQPLWAAVNASLNRDRIQDGDSVTLRIEVTGDEDAGQPDLSVLTADFEILGTSTSQQYQFINGQRSGSRAWQIELLPLRSGDIEVPAIPLGNSRTQPLKLKVSDQPATGAAGESRKVFLKTLIEPVDAEPYVQQQVNYTLQLYIREPLLSGGFNGPDIGKALLERLGEDVSYSTRIDGQEYQVVERRYAVFPQQSGVLVIPPVVFTGQLQAQSTGRRPPAGISSMLDDFMRGMPFGSPGRRVRVRSEEQTLTVKPRPQGFHGTDWLPAKEIRLHDSWADEPPEFRVGEPVTRTVTLEATGLAGSQLPPPHLKEVSGMRSYPEQPVRESHMDGKWVRGSSRQAVAYVPTTDGKVRIPEIRVDWWDTGAKQLRTALLPAWEVTVQPGTLPAGHPQVTAATAPPAVVGTAAAPQESDAGVPSVGKGFGVVRENWTWLAGGVLLAVLLYALLRLARHARRPRSPKSPVAGPVESTSGQRHQAALGALEQACIRNDPRSAAQALLQLAAFEWPDEPPRSLGLLARRLVVGADAIRQLERALYAAGETAWQGNELWARFQHGLTEQESAAADTGEGLAPLYPEWETRQR